MAPLQRCAAVVQDHAHDRYPAPSHTGGGGVRLPGGWLAIGGLCDGMQGVYLPPTRPQAPFPPLPAATCRFLTPLFAPCRWLWPRLCRPWRPLRRPRSLGHAPPPLMHPDKLAGDRTAPRGGILASFQRLPAEGRPGAGGARVRGASYGPRAAQGGLGLVRWWSPAMLRPVGCLGRLVCAVHGPP